MTQPSTPTDEDETTTTPESARSPERGPATQPGPSGGSEEPLAAVVDPLGPRGFTVVPEGRVRCDTCRTEMPAEAVVVHGSRRLEGASDPSDMSMVHALRCPSCGADGALVTRYGPEASADEADVLVALDREWDHGSAS